MGFGEKLILNLLRPIYRAFFERLLWRFLLKLKNFFLTEVSARLENIEGQLSELPATKKAYADLEERLREIEANNAAEWDAIEQLLLAQFRQPELQEPRSAREATRFSYRPTSEETR